MAQRWVHSALGSGDERSAREDAVVAAWEGIRFAGVPPLRSAPLRYFPGGMSRQQGLYIRLVSIMI